LRVARYVVIGGVMDFTVYVTVALCALLALRWGADALTLGLLPAVWASVYAIAATFLGRVSDRVSRTTLARGGLLLVAATCVLFTRASAPWHFILGLPFIAIGSASFWPSLQAAIADESGPGDLTRNLGLFNISWSVGKGSGVLVGGLISDGIGQDGFLLSAATAVILTVVLPRVAHGGGRGSSLVGEDEPVPVRTRDAFRWAALLANFAAYGAATSIVNHYPLLNRNLGRSGTEYGIVVGTVFFSQTLVFAVLLFRTRWHYRAGIHLGLQVLSMVGVVLLAAGWPVLVQLPFVLLIGGGLALAYYSSIYYSLHADAGRGGRAGLHETLIGSGSFLVPFLGGAAATAAGRATVPYFLAGAVLLVSIVTQAVILRRGRL
jgi:predicted MFS family arabinose efflux permease